MKYRLLSRFASLFQGKVYNHRRSNLGDTVALELYEDLFTLGRSAKYVAAVRARIAVANTPNLVVGRSSRRGDGTLGQAVPNISIAVVPGYEVARGPVATLDVGAETKILAKAMIKQIDRVISDLNRQAEHFEKQNQHCLRVAIVGINTADRYVSFEGKRSFPTDGKKYKHPVQEASEAERRIVERVTPHYHELLVLRFRAVNAKPFPFEWVDTARTEREYGAALVRLSNEYQRRF